MAKITMKEQPESSQAGTEVAPTRRRGGRRRGFRMPRPVAAVRGLWESATEEQRQRAHRSAAAVMEYWLGRATKVEAASRLEVPPLRIWQLSQQALSGMVAGLLKQPKSRKGGVAVDPSEDPKTLRKRIVDLERTIAMQDRLIAVLREMPGCREVQTPEPQPPQEGKRGRKAKKGVLPGAQGEHRQVADGGSGGSKA